MGAKNADAATTSSNAGLTSVKNMMKHLGGVNIAVMTDANLAGFCKAVYKRQEEGGACGQTFNLMRKSNGHVLAQPILNCRGELEMYVTMTLCVQPCMNDPNTPCCFVPGLFAIMFPCLRLGCGKYTPESALCASEFCVCEREKNIKSD